MQSLNEIYYGEELKVFIYNPEHQSSLRAAELILSLDCEVCEDLVKADLAIAPMLDKKLTPDEFNKPRLGTLIFHPSLLPRHRGPDAIKWAYKLNESYTGVTWFWCSEGFDEGDICEQEIVKLDLTVRPGEFYKNEIIPAMLTTLRRAIEDLKRDVVRKVPQNHNAATYEKKLLKSELANV